MQNGGVQPRLARIVPRKLLRWFVLPLITLVWLPVLILEIVFRFKPSDGVASAGVMWLAVIAFPATLVCAALVSLIVVVRIFRRRPSS